MNNENINPKMREAKAKSRGVGTDMSSEAILRRLEIVDELREFANELKQAKRLGPLAPKNES